MRRVATVMLLIGCTLILGSPAAGGVAAPATAAELTYPADAAVDGHGNLVIADKLSHRVRMVTG